MEHYDELERAVWLGGRVSSGVELSDILSEYLPSYLKSHKLSNQQKKVLGSIQSCRTARLGAHVRKCNNESCDYVEIAYNSCRDRHCPKCQGSARSNWMDSRVKDLLPIPYYHVVFTMPHELNDLSLCNKSLIYNLFMKSSAETLQSFGRDARYLGGELGLIMILHTWGQRLNYHVHVHVIVTGGGFNSKENKWKELPYAKKFLFPVKAMSDVMRGKFLEGLKSVYGKDKLCFPGDLGYLKSHLHFEEYVNTLSRKEWLVYSKPPFNYSGSGIGGEEELKYISDYVSKTAISNHRLQSFGEDGCVSFRYRDYRDDRKQKIAGISGVEFVRRFLLHILPKGFKRIRHYGILAGSCKGVLQKVKSLLNVVKEEVLEELSSLLPDDSGLCPRCRLGDLRLIDYILACKLNPVYANP